MNWARILAYVTGTVDQELLLRNEYLAAENCILKAQLKGRLRLSDAEPATLGEIAHRLLGEVANVAGPDTIFGQRHRSRQQGDRRPERGARQGTRRRQHFLKGCADCGPCRGDRCFGLEQYPRPVSRGANSMSDEASKIGSEAAKLGNDALRRLSKELEQAA
jgi:hypothetical protein